MWLKEKLICKRVITKELKKNFGHKIKELKYSTHHLSHAASSFFPSPYDDAVILCLDGVGKWATTSCWRGQKSSIKPLWEIQFPNSLGLLYTSFTTYLGFKANCDEYKIMGLGKECSKTIGSDKQKSSLFSPEFSNEEIEKFLTEQNTKFTKFENEDELCSHVASLIENENVIGWFQGKTEFGPRALGSRSIIADPRSGHMQKTLNLKIKFRESFRPFAPIVKEDKVSDFFDFQGKSPYMLLVSPVKEEILINNEEAKNLEGIDKLNAKRSQLPAITHVDNSVRLQTVSNKSNPRLYKLLDKFETNTGVPVLVNTSFNVRVEPDQRLDFNTPF